MKTTINNTEKIKLTGIENMAMADQTVQYSAYALKQILSNNVLYTTYLKQKELIDLSIPVYSHSATMVFAVDAYIKNISVFKRIWYWYRRYDLLWKLKFFFKYGEWVK